MTLHPMPRKVLIVEDQPSMRNVLYVLLAGVGCDGDVATGAKMALSMIQQAQFDAVLLDLRCSELPAEEMVSKIKVLSPNLVGRVLVITGDVTDPQTMEMIERNCLPHVPRNRVAEELWGRLRSLLGLSRSPADSTS
jgi:DNA-binding NtrC family response regulator